MPTKHKSLLQLRQGCALCNIATCACAAPSDDLGLSRPGLLPKPSLATSFGQAVALYCAGDRVDVRGDAGGAGRRDQRPARALAAVQAENLTLQVLTAAANVPAAVRDYMLTRLSRAASSRNSADLVLSRRRAMQSSCCMHAHGHGDTVSCQVVRLWIQQTCPQKHARCSRLYNCAAVCCRRMPSRRSACRARPRRRPPLASRSPLWLP